MAQLDETITTGDLGHESDHEALARKANYVFDVTDFGAVSHGYTDNTTAIQSAIDAAVAEEGGGIVFFPAGTYSVTNLDLDGSRNLTFRGVAGGRNAASRLRTNAADSSSMISVGQSNHLTFEYMMFEAWNSGFSGTLIDGTAHVPAGTWEENAALDVRIEHCTFFPQDQNSTNVKVGAAFDWVIRDCLFNRGAVAVDGIGIALNNSNTVSILNCRFSSHYATAQIKNPNGWTIRGCAGEPLESGAPGFIKFDSGVSSSATIVEGNWLGDVTAKGTWIEAAGLGWVISGNLIHTGTGSTGIEIVGDLDGLAVHGNWFYAGGYSVNFVNMLDRNTSDFIDDAGGWIAISRTDGGALTTDGSPLTGSNCLKVTSTSVGTSAGNSIGLPYVAGTTIYWLADPGDDRVFKANVKAESGATDYEAQVLILWYDDAGNLLTGGAASAWTAIDDSSWTEIAVANATGPATTTRACARVTVRHDDTTGLAIGEFYYVDKTTGAEGSVTGDVEDARTTNVNISGNYIGATSVHGALPAGTVYQDANETTVADAVVGDTYGKVGFYGATAVAKPEVTGARDDGTALADLLTTLETLGMIADSSTAS